MRNPYITGRWVSGREHYGRQTLLAHILKSPEHALWVVGNRRMGKTSLLRQLELVADADSAYVPLFWDMQGSQRIQDLAAELIYAVEEQEERFQEALREKRRQGYPEVPIDRQFLGELGYGMPPAAGIALGVERLLMALTGSEHIDDFFFLPHRWDAGDEQSLWPL